MQNDVRLIDANAASDLLLRHGKKYESIGRPEEAKDYERMAYVISNKKCFPTIDAVPVVHGRWIASEFPQEKYCCSACGGACWYYDYEGEVAKSRYCPNCGAKMDGGTENG